MLGKRRKLPGTILSYIDYSFDPEASRSKSKNSSGFPGESDGKERALHGPRAFRSGGARYQNANRNRRRLDCCLFCRRLSRGAPGQRVLRANLKKMVGRMLKGLLFLALLWATALRPCVPNACAVNCASKSATHKVPRSPRRRNCLAKPIRCIAPFKSPGRPLYRAGTPVWCLSLQRPRRRICPVEQARGHALRNSSDVAVALGLAPVATQIQVTDSATS